MERVSVTINGQAIQAKAGQTILEVVQEQKLDEIPTLCHSPELKPYGSCFVCVVEVKGRPNLLPSCATRVAEGMEIETGNQRIRASRKTALELLLSNHYADCASPCQLGCPAGVDAQGYIALAAMGEYRGAVDLIRETNPLPLICGRVCVRKCEVVCRREDVDTPVGINAIKRFVTDAPGVYDRQPDCEPSKGKSVGIVGAGPSGLTAAWFLGKQGYKPVMYEAMEKAGGMLRYGIPAYRLTDEDLDKEIEYICRAGGEIRFGVRVGQDVTLEQLRKEHDAIYLAAGAWEGKPMRVEGEFETEGIVSGVDFLQDMVKQPTQLSGTVVVVGGGNTAMDVARTSWRLNADKVIILYRRTKNEMPADPMEIQDCIDEGIEILELAAPIGIVEEGGKLQALRCIRMKLGEPDSSGRRRPVPNEGSEFDLPCDLAVSAIGQGPILDGLREFGEGLDLDVSRWNTIEVNTRTMETNIEGVFAGGDAADDGPTVVIDAIGDGQKAAKTIMAYLSGDPREQDPFVVQKAFWSKPGQAELGSIAESPRHEVHHRPVSERVGSFEEVATGFDYEDKVHECARCLECGCVLFDTCSLRLYGEAYDVDMEQFKGYVRKHKVDERHPYIVYDPNKCILCARCIRTCERVLPISALGLVGRGFTTEMRPAMNDPLVETNCVSCGNCVDACPVGALTVKYPFLGRAALDTKTVATHCAFCSLACPIRVESFGGTRTYVTSSGVPGEYLCRYGRFGNELFVKQKRYERPVLRVGPDTREIEHEEAYLRIVDGMKEMLEKHGPEGIGVFVSPELTNEEFYLAARIAREGLGTNNVGSLSILAAGRTSGALDAQLGVTASTADRSVLAEADLIICNNTAMEADHLILAVDVIEAVRGGAKLVVSNSSLDAADQFLAKVSMDPMRGRAALLWNGVLQLLLDEGHFSASQVAELPGAEEFLRERDFELANVAELCGVNEATIRRSADLIRDAERVVIIHSPDRPQDLAPGDMETLTNLVLLLRARGAKADLLLPRINANSAGLELAGADPAFLPGRKPVDGLPGAGSHEELITLLKEGRIRAAIILGEDPLRQDRTAAWFQNLEFLAAMDWTETETTLFADITLPGTTFLETEGTRCSFEGRLIPYTKAVQPPSGKPGWQVLAELAREYGLGDGYDSAKQLTAELDAIVHESLDEKAGYYWNRGEEQVPLPTGSLAAAPQKGRAGSIQPPLTHSERYKKEIRDVGTERYRVH